MTATMTQLTALLSGLGRRARMPDKPDLSPAIGIINDLGRLMMLGSEADIRHAQAAVAAVREQLSGEDATNYPQSALTGRDSHSYLAGALWAVNEMMSARLDAVSSATHPRMTRKSQVKDKVLSALASGRAMSPTAIQDDSDDASIRLDEISRALGDLLAAELVEIRPPAPGSDRRTKCFALTSDGRAALAERSAVMYASAR